MLEELDYPSLICEDGIHPNEAGHEIIARRAIEHFPHKE
jgi:lysophospholipase L1-like esterase